MRLLSLELHGFKSFPDKTVLKFAPGVTIVIGPNGSGKSNISDAVRWVLGEMVNSKSMRGSKSEDVIFGGADTRKPMSYAEVSITFDNREEAGFSRLASDYDEVTVTRRYNRNGTSEYMINRQAVRLKDINTLFMNTGVGKGGYSIVSQGKVAEIISQKSDERRNIFEEAAGISKYRSQKEAAEKDLAATALNCERLADILLERKTTLDKLEKDAERARKYLDVYEKKKEADVSLSVYDITLTREQLTEKQGKFDELTKALTLADNEITDANSESERLDIERNRAKEKASSLTSKIEGMASDRAKSDTRVQVLANDIEHLNADIDTSNENLKALNEELVELKAKADAAHAELNKAIEVYGSASEKVDTLQSELDAIKSDIDDIEIAIEDELAENDRLNDELDALRFSGASLEGSESSNVERRAEIENEIVETEKSTDTCKAGMEQYKRRLDDYDEREKKLRADEEKNTAKINELNASKAALNDKIVEYASDIRDIRTRIDSLRRMEELFEGYPHSVSALMNAAKSGKIQGIIGPLSHIFSVDREFSLAIETALGANIQNIVTENDSAAKSAVQWLKQNNAGRCTFYPLNTMQVTPLNINISDLEKRKGFIGVASDLIEYDDKFDRVMKNLLGRTLVFDNLDNANDTSKAFGYRVRIVTKDGQLVNAGGSITGGAAKRESGVLNRTANIDTLNAEKIRIEAAKKAAEEDYAKIVDELAVIEADSAENNKKLTIIASLSQADMKQYTAFETQLQGVNDTIARLKDQLTDIDNSETRLKEEKERIASDMEKLKGEIEACEARKAEKAEKRTSLKADYDKKSDEYNQSRIVLAGLEKDVEAARRELEIKAEAQSDCESEIESENSFIERAREQIQSKKDEMVRLATETDNYDETIQQMTSDRDTAEALTSELDAKITAIGRSIQDKMSAREVLSNDHTNLTNKIEALQNNLDNMIAYLQTEYEITFSEAQAMNYPPVTKENRSEIAHTLQELKYKLRGIGSVDPSSIEEYKSAQVAYDEMNAQFEDLTKSRTEFENTIEVLEREMRGKFTTVMSDINTAFKRVFRELFGGGNAELVLTDPEDVLHCGIEINVALPGKNITNLSLLSGGEQSFISIALLFAILNVNPTPFCIFDEIEAALDEVNVAVFANYIKKYSDKTQFITITHRRGTMEAADTLYGVTMAEKGISRVLTLNVGEVEAKLGVKL